MKLLITMSFLTATMFSFSASAELLLRLNGEAVYDDVTNRTYIADANYAETILDENLAQRIMDFATASNGYQTYNVVETDFKKNAQGEYTGSMTALATWGFAELLSFSGVGGWEVPIAADILSLFFESEPIGLNGQFTLSDLFYNIPDFSEEYRDEYNDVILEAGFYRMAANGGADQGLTDCFEIPGVVQPFGGGYPLCPWSGSQDHGADVYALLSTGGDVFPAVVPLPGTLTLISFGLASFGWSRRKKAKE